MAEAVQVQDKMIKAYFFDWMGTVGTCRDVLNFQKFLTQEEHGRLLLTSKFEQLDLNGKEELIYGGINGASHRLYEDSESVIKDLKKKGFGLALVSNVYCGTSERLRKLFPSIIRDFDVVTFSSEVGMKKPDLDIFKYTLERLNKFYGGEILPEEVVMIGDEYEKDVAPPLKLGMQARLIDRTVQKLEDVI